MFVPFRQGVVSHSPSPFTVIGNKVSINVVDIPFVFALAQGTNNYLVVYSQSVTNAWTLLPGGIDQWLYLDISLRDGSTSFGVTPFAPVFGPTAPASPPVGKLWYNTLNSTMSEWNGVQWKMVVRVFACFMNNGSVPISMGDVPPPIANFTGTQVGNNVGAFTGQILYDVISNKGVRKTDTSFMTTEDRLSTLGTLANSVKVASLIINAESQQNIAAYSVVQFSDFNKCVYSDAFAAGLGIPYGIIQTPGFVGEIVQVTMEGMVENPAWDFSVAGAGIGNLGLFPTPLTVNDPLYCNATGQLTSVPVIPNQVPVAYVVGRNSILLIQPRVEQITINNPDVELASLSTYGIVRLATPPANGADPIAVGDNDPRLTDARPPLPHTHPISEVIGLQSALDNKQDLDDDLTALADTNTTGIYVITGAGTSATRSLVAPAEGLTITNPAGIAGDPIFALANDLAALEGLTTYGLTVRTSTDTWNTRTIVGVMGDIDVTDGDGVAGNPTIDLADVPVTTGTYGDSSNIPVVTVDQKGRVTTITTVPASGGGGGGTPSAPLNSIQFNNSGAFGGSANLIWNSGSNRLETSNFFHNTLLNFTTGGAGTFQVTTNDINLNTTNLSISLTQPLVINGSPGTSEYVLTSQGAALPPVWAPASGLINEPATQIVYGTGTGVTSDPNFTYTSSTGRFWVNTNDGFSGIVVAAPAFPIAVGIFAPNSSGLSPGGGINIQAGYSTGNGGGVTITGGIGNIGGDVQITSGVGITNGGELRLLGNQGISAGGDIRIEAGASSAVPGDVVVTGGGHSSSGTAGSVTVRGGDPNTFFGGPFASNGGSATVRGGDALFSRNGGPVTIRGGNSSGSGNGGNVTIAGGTTVSGTPGTITLQTTGVSRIVFQTDGTWNIGGSIGTSGQVLTSNGAGTPPTWQSPVVVSEPANYIVYGTGTGVDSDSDLQWDPSTNVLSVNGTRTQRDGNFSVNGDAQELNKILRQATANAAPTVMSSGSSLVMPDNTTWRFEIFVVARRVGASDNAAFRLTGCIARDMGVGTTAIIGTVAKVIDAQSTGALTWDANASANTSSGSLEITVTGQIAVNIRWVAFVKLVQVQS